MQKNTKKYIFFAFFSIHCREVAVLCSTFAVEIKKFYNYGNEQLSN